MSRTLSWFLLHTRRLDLNFNFLKRAAIEGRSKGGAQTGHLCQVGSGLAESETMRIALVLCSCDANCCAVERDEAAFRF